jgi:nucleoside-diphosphate-sugar epimerase
MKKQYEGTREVIAADIYSILSDTNIPWDEMKDSVVLVTGATGLVGGALVRTLSAANKKYGLGMRIIGHGRNAEKGDALSKEFGIEFVNGDIRRHSTLSDIVDRLDYVFHCAAITTSADMISKPLSVLTTSFEGTKNVLELAQNKQCKSFVYLSSMEIYGQNDLQEICEKDLGYLDLSNPRSCYPESKRFCEMLCVSYAVEWSFPVKIARLAQTFGAGTPKDDTRVFAQFSRSAMAGENITLHTEGKSRGNYCYISDAMRGLLTILLKGENGESYNIANPEASKTIREMAELVANDICGGKIEVVVNIPDDVASRGYAPNVGFILNVDKLKNLGWKPMHGLVDMYKRLIADWQGR